MTLRIQLLGPPRVSVDGRPLVVDTRKAIALLAYLAIVDRPIGRDPLAELLWPDADPADGRAALRRTLSVLRTGLGGRWLEVDRRQVALTRSSVDLDVARFRSAARGSTRSALADAVATYEADFLEGFSLRDSPAFDGWQLLEAEALRAELAGVLRRLLALEEAAGRFPEAIAVGRRLVAVDSLDEAAHRSLIALLDRSGDRAAAMRQYRECVRLLDAELGVEPGPDTAAVYRSLLEPAPAAPFAARSPAMAPPVSAPSPAPDARSSELLAAVVTVGGVADPDLLAAVLERTISDVESGLQALVAAGLLIEPRADDVADRFRVAPVVDRAALLEHVGATRRRSLRRNAAEALVAAGDAARRRGAHADAAQRYRTAMELGQSDGLTLLEAIGDVDTLRGRYGEALATYERAAAMAPSERVAAFEHRLGSLHLRRGALELADLHFSAAMARLAPGPSRLRALVLGDQSLIALRRGSLDPAASLAHRSRRTARAAHDPEAEAQAENLLAMVARRHGDIVAARRHLHRSLERAGLANEPWARIGALNSLALLERAAGNFDDALALTEEALRRCVIAGDRHREAALRNHRADLLHALGRHREAKEEQLRSVTAFAEVGESATEPEIWKLVEW